MSLLYIYRHPHARGLPGTTCGCEGSISLTEPAEGAIFLCNKAGPSQARMHLAREKCISPADLLIRASPGIYPLSDQTNGGFRHEETV